MYKVGLMVISLLIHQQGANSDQLHASFTKVECENYAPDIILNMSCELHQLRKNAPLTFYADLMLAHDISNLTDDFKLKVKRGNKKDNQFALNIDICQALYKNLDNNVMNKLGIELRRISNFPFKCPLKKNILYKINDFAIDRIRLPSYLPDLSFIVDSDFYAKGRKIATFSEQGRLKRHKQNTRGLGFH